MSEVSMTVNGRSVSGSVEDVHCLCSLFASICV